MDKIQQHTSSQCQVEVPCLDFSDQTHYAVLTLDIEGNEWDFLKMRRPRADLLMIEVIQWARRMNQLDVLIELTAHMADIGYYLYEETLGFRNFLFISQDLAHNCFEDHISK